MVRLFLFSFNYLIVTAQLIYLKNAKCPFYIPKSFSFNMLFAPYKSGSPSVASCSDLYLNVLVHLFFKAL